MVSGCMGNYFHPNDRRKERKEEENIIYTEAPAFGLLRKRPAAQEVKAKIIVVLGSSPTAMGFPSDSAGKNPPAMQETQQTQVQSLDQEDLLE